jgi:hypothetical protein
LEHLVVLGDYGQAVLVSAGVVTIRQATISHSTGMSVGTGIARV